MNEPPYTTISNPSHCAALPALDAENVPVTVKPSSSSRFVSYKILHHDPPARDGLSTHTVEMQKSDDLENWQSIAVENSAGPVQQFYRLKLA